MELTSVNKLVSCFIDSIIRESMKSKRVVFLSRDGYRLKVLFDEVVKKRGLDIESSYLPVSRKFLNLSNIRCVDDVAFLLSQPCSPCSLLYLLTERFYCSNDVVAEICNDIKIDSNDVVHRSKNVELFGLLSEAIFKRMAEKYSKMRDAAERYYRSSLISGDIIVDIGYRGTIQALLERLLSIDLFGYYLLANESEISRYLKENSYKYIVGFKKSGLLSSNLMLFENIFNAPHGSLKNIINIDGDYVEEFELTPSNFNHSINVRYEKYFKSLASYYAYDLILNVNDRKYLFFSQSYVDDGFGGRSERYLVHQCSDDNIGLNCLFDNLELSGWKEGYIYYLSSNSNYISFSRREILKSILFTLKQCVKIMIKNKSVYLIVCKIRVLLRLL